MFNKLVLHTVLLDTGTLFLAAKIENKMPIKGTRILNSERKTAFTAGAVLTFAVAENVTSPAVVKGKYM